jgi:hypothetical protein
MATQQKSFTGFPYGLGAPGVDALAVTADGITLPQTTTKTLFTISGGPIEVMKIFGICTVAIGAVANATKLQAVISVNAANVTTDICATVDINAMTLGSIYELVTSSSTAAVISTVGLYPLASSTVYYRFVMNVGSIIINCAGSDGGAGKIQWFMHYRPLSVGVSQAGLVQITSASS